MGHILVKDIYNIVANNCGFPFYTSAGDTPETTAFLLNRISEGLLNTVDRLYLSNNIRERTQRIITTPQVDRYSINGIIKNAQIKVNGKYEKLPFIEGVDQHTVQDKSLEACAKPDGYVIEGGYLKLIKAPDKEYEILLTISTNDFVLADDNTSRVSVRSVNDIIVGDELFADLVIAKSTQFIMLRLNNPLAGIYEQIFERRMATFLENDSGTMEAQRLNKKNFGHFNPGRGLLG